MGVQVSGSNVGVTIENADSINWTSNLLFSVDNTYDIGAAGATRPRTGYFATSLVSPSLTYAGTLALSATGANPVTTATNGTVRVTVTSGGHVNIGVATVDAANNAVQMLAVNTSGSGPAMIRIRPNFSGTAGVDDTSVLSMFASGVQEIPWWANRNYLFGVAATAGGTNYTEAGMLAASKLLVTTAGNILINTAADIGSNGGFRFTIKHNSIYNAVEDGAFVIANSTNTTKRLIFGYDNATSAFIQAVNAGTGYTPLLLQAAGGNVLINTATDDGSSKLQVAGKTSVSASVSADVIGSFANTSATGYGLRVTAGTSGYYTQRWFDKDSNSLAELTDGTFTVFNQKATTGVTQAVIRAGAGQSTTALTTWQNNAGTALAYVSSAGALVGTSLVSINTGASAIAITDAGTGTNYYLSGYSFKHGGLDRWLIYKNSDSAANLVFARYDNAGAFVDSPLVIGRADGALYIANGTGKVGFFGATPVAKQTVTADAASILAALQAYGLAV